MNDKIKHTISKQMNQNERIEEVIIGYGFNPNSILDDGNTVFSKFEAAILNMIDECEELLPEITE